jgi:hypothetical protein
MVVALSTGSVVTACGGNGEHPKRVTLTDEGCSYEGKTTLTPGLFTVEARNETGHFAEFAIWELAKGVQLEDVGPAFEQARRYYERKGYWPRISELKRAASWAAVNPRASSELPVNESAGRFVLYCSVLPSVDTRPTSDAPIFPDRVYPIVELDIKATS